MTQMHLMPRCEIQTKHHSDVMFIYCVARMQMGVADQVYAWLDVYADLMADQEPESGQRHLDAILVGELHQEHQEDTTNEFHRSLLAQLAML
jgi:hypothetical protein